MKRTATAGALFLLIVVTTTSLVRAGERELDADINYVLDPHATPNVKAAAIHRLGEQGRVAGRALPALLRQSHRGSTAIREAARDAVLDIAGGEEGRRLLAEFPRAAATDEPPGAEFRRNWLAVAGDRPGADLPDDPRRAVAVAAEVVRADPRRVQMSPDEVKSALAAAIYDLDRADPTARADLLDLVEAFGPGRAPCVRLLFRVSADDGPKSDPAVRERAASLLKTALRPDVRTPETFVGLVAGLTDLDPKVADLAKAVVPKDAVASLKVALAHEVARRAERGDLDAVAVLKRHEVEAATFAQAIRRHLEIAKTDTTRLRLVRALQQADAGPAVAQTQGLHGLVVQCLGRPGALAEQVAPGERRNRAGERVAAPTAIDLANADALAVAAKDLLLAGDRPHAAEQALADAVGQGLVLSPKVVRAFGPDRRELAGLLVRPLGEGLPAVRLSAARALAVVGVPDDAADTRAALDRALRSPDAEIRRAAAEALGTPTALAMVRVPELLRDLAADSPGTRQVAARQIQSMGLDAPEVTALLVRATDQGDMATREGLRLALERAFTSARPAREELADLGAAANGDATTRAYARAALRQLPPR